MSKQPALLSQVVSESEVPIDSWDDLEKFLRDLGHTRGRWCFRGHRCANWRLESSLERLTKGNRDRIRAEDLLIKSFQRRAHHFISNLPANDDLLEWLALMQHWGVATRLLDFTMSPYVASFFAINDALSTPDNGGQEWRSAIWAVNHVSCKGIAATALNQTLPDQYRFSHSTFMGEPTLFKEVFFAKDVPYLVVPVQPFRLNERQAIQQGLFLCQTSLNLTFDETFVQADALQSFLQNRGSLANENSMEDVVRENLRKLVRKAVISERGAREILPQLYSMKLNSGSLFPDIQGFSRSINERYRSLQLLPNAEKPIVGFDSISEFDALG